MRVNPFLLSSSPSSAGLLPLDLSGGELGFKSGRFERIHRVEGLPPQNFGSWFLPEEILEVGWMDPRSGVRVRSAGVVEAIAEEGGQGGVEESYTWSQDVSLPNPLDQTAQFSPISSTGVGASLSSEVNKEEQDIPSFEGSPWTSKNSEHSHVGTPPQKQRRRQEEASDAPPGESEPSDPISPPGEDETSDKGEQERLNPRQSHEMPRAVEMLNDSPSIPPFELFEAETQIKEKAIMKSPPASRVSVSCRFKDLDVTEEEEFVEPEKLTPSPPVPEGGTSSKKSKHKKKRRNQVESAESLFALSGGEGGTFDLTDAFVSLQNLGLKLGVDILDPSSVGDEEVHLPDLKGFEVPTFPKDSMDVYFLMHLMPPVGASTSGRKFSVLDPFAGTIMLYKVATPQIIESFKVVKGMSGFIPFWLEMGKDQGLGLLGPFGRVALKKEKMKPTALSKLDKASLTRVAGELCRMEGGRRAESGSELERRGRRTLKDCSDSGYVSPSAFLHLDWDPRVVRYYMTGADEGGVLKTSGFFISEDNVADSRKMESLLRNIDGTAIIALKLADVEGESFGHLGKGVFEKFLAWRNPGKNVDKSVEFLRRVLDASPLRKLWIFVKTKPTLMSSMSEVKGSMRVTLLGDLNPSAPSLKDCKASDSACGYYTDYC